MKFLTFVLLFYSFSNCWLGIKFSEKEKKVDTVNYQDTLQLEILKVRHMHDSLFQNRQSVKMPIDSQGIYIGDFKEIKCINCIPDMVELIVSDTSHDYQFVITVRENVWKAVEKPIKDKRIFELSQNYFHFGINQIDTVYSSSLDMYVKQVNHEIPVFPFIKKIPLTNMEKIYIIN